MIVAARATRGLAEESFAEGVDLLIDHIEAKLLLILLLVICRAEGEEGGRGELAAALGMVLRGQEITGDLFADELVEGPVLH